METLKTLARIISCIAGCVFFIVCMGWIQQDIRLLASGDLGAHWAMLTVAMALMCVFLVLVGAFVVAALTALVGVVQLVRSFT